MGRAARRLTPAIAAAVAAALVVAGCGLGSPSPSPAPTASPFVPPPAPTTVDALACIDIGAQECEQLAGRILAGLPGIDGQPFSIRINLGACLDDGDDCPRSLLDRLGTAIVEYPDGGEAILFELQGPPAEPVIDRNAEVDWTDPIPPGSPPVEGDGPFDFEVGHCGLLHVVDFDGSFWVLVGDYEGDHPALVNSEHGSIDLVAPNRARYVGPDDEPFDLVRFPGSKRFQLCD
ncbi:MAG TPA: hypothetical protein VNL94_05570 [Candidatus Binatia bacterium]|nr:hypothetical protein [Candidatus Binatia bacterium]